MAAIAFDTTGRFILFVLFLAVTVLFVADPATRAKIMNAGEYVYERIKCILGSECLGGEDDTTAVDSTKALACAIDATAYWSDTTDPKRAAALKARLDDIKIPDAPKGLFDDIAGDRISSCTGETKAPDIPAAPTNNAIGAHLGSILSKLSEWSGGDNGITGNAVGNRVTGSFWSEIGSGISWAWKGVKWVAGGAIDTVAHPINAIDKLDGTDPCSVKDDKGKDMKVMCKDLNGPENSHSCNSGDIKITCCDGGWNTNTYCCNEGYAPDGQGNCKKLDPGQIKAEAVEHANDVLRDNKGKAMRFGKTSVVCKPVSETTQSTKNNVAPNSDCNMADSGSEKCGTDGNIYRCSSPISGSDYLLSRECPYGCKYEGALNTGPKCIELSETLSSPNVKVQCNIKAFELPQYVKGDILDYVAKWVGVFGEPKYLVYHETFPTGVEAVWTYDWEDSIVSAWAVGGLLNLGGGAVKSAWAGVAKVASKDGLVILRREGLSAVLSAGKTAAAERLGLEYGGEVAAKKILARQFSSAFHGLPQIESKIFNVMEKAMLRPKPGATKLTEIARVNKYLGPAQSAKFMADMSLVVRSAEKEVPVEVLEKMVDDAGVDSALKWGGQDVSDINKISKELEDMKQTWNDGNLFSDPEKKELQETIKKEVGEGAATSAAMQAIVSRSTKDGLWMFRNLRALLKTPGYKAAYAKNMKAEVEELAKMTFDDIDRTAYNLEKTCGQKCAETYIDGMYVKTYDTLEVLPEDDLKTLVTNGLVTKEDYKAAAGLLKDDAVSVLKGYTGMKRTGSWYTFDRQKKVMAVTLAVSYLAQKKDANLEKYKSCGQGKVCLHIPKWFLLQREFFSDQGSTKSYGDGTDVKKSFNDLVSLAGFSGGETLRLNLMSPCKADIQVKADSSACKCENFYGKNEIAYRLDKVLCLLDVNKNGEFDGKDELIAVNLEQDGACPKEYKVPNTVNLKLKDAPGDVIGKTLGLTSETINAGTYPVLTVPAMINPWKDLYFQLSLIYDKETLGPFGNDECPVVGGEDLMATLQKCVDKKMKDNAGNVKNEYKECNEAGAADGGCSKYNARRTWVMTWVVDGTEKIPFYDTKSQKINVVPVPLNILPSVDKTKPAETISVCENSWVAEKLRAINIKPDKEDFEHPCITVTRDAGSMKTYSEAGFGTNFCAKSDISVMAKVESACFWGTIAVSIGAEMASMGAATPVVLYAVGSSGAVCEKLAGMSQKWPNNQF